MFFAVIFPVFAYGYPKPHQPIQPVDRIHFYCNYLDIGSIGRQSGRLGLHQAPLVPDHSGDVH